ncbi:Probable transmembrane protein [Polaromonas sp. CG9_12]|nr:Probable transmembrane protein [Polaromonas sp. CG9_12]
MLPLIALVTGLLVINTFQSDNRTQELAEVDAALLTDDLPPAAFADPGFVQFLKTRRQPASPL